MAYRKQRRLDRLHTKPHTRNETPHNNSHNSQLSNPIGTSNDNTISPSSLISAPIARFDLAKCLIDLYGEKVRLRQPLVNAELQFGIAVIAFSNVFVGGGALVGRAARIATIEAQLVLAIAQIVLVVRRVIATARREYLIHHQQLALIAIFVLFPIGEKTQKFRTSKERYI